MARREGLGPGRSAPHDCGVRGQMTEMALHPDQPHPSCQLRDSLCAPRPLCFPGDKWRLPVPRKLEVYWGNQHGELSSHSSVSSPIVAPWPAGLLGGAGPLCPRRGFHRPQLRPWGGAWPSPCWMPRGLLRLGAFSPAPVPTPAGPARCRPGGNFCRCFLSIPQDRTP